MINNFKSNNIAKEIYNDLKDKTKEEIIDIVASQTLVIFQREKEIKALKEELRIAKMSDKDTYETSQEIMAEQSKEIERLNKKYENAVADYEEQKYIITELEKAINEFDVFKNFSFPLMKKWEENQVKSSIDYEWRKSIKEPFLNKIKELKEKGGDNNEPSK